MYAHGLFAKHWNNSVLELKCIFFLSIQRYSQCDSAGVADQCDSCVILLLSNSIVQYCQVRLLEPCSGPWHNFEEAKQLFCNCCRPLAYTRGVPVQRAVERDEIPYPYKVHDTTLRAIYIIKERLET